MDQPAPGERPFNIKKPTFEEVRNSKGFSVLNEMRLKQHVRQFLNNIIQENNVERDPKFITAKEKFYGLEKPKPVKSVTSNGSKSVKSM